MSKGYTMVREDLADLTEVQTAVNDSPHSYGLGTTIVDATGARHVVTSNDGTTVVLSTVSTGGGGEIPEGYTAGVYNTVDNVAEVDLTANATLPSAPEVHMTVTGGTAVNLPAPIFVGQIMTVRSTVDYLTVWKLYHSVSPEPAKGFDNIQISKGGQGMTVICFDTGVSFAPLGWKIVSIFNSVDPTDLPVITYP